MWTRISRALIFTAGTASFALSAWMIAGWHSPEPAGRARLGLERMQYDTAWAFAFAGLAVVALLFRVDFPGRLLAAVPMVLGGLRLAAYLTPLAIPIHPMLGTRWLPLGPGNYNDMGVLTAVVLVVLGAAIATLHPHDRGKFRSVIVTLLASSSLALALVLFFGAWAGGVVAQQWLQLAGGEQTHALVAVTLAAAAVAYAVVGTEEAHRAIARWLPVIVWFAVFVCVLVLWRALANHETRLIQASARTVTSDIQGQIERGITTRVQLLQRLAKRTEIYRTTPEQWQQDAADLLGDHPEFQAVVWAGDDYVTQWVAPESEMRTAGYNLLSDPVRRAAVLEAVRTRQPTLSRFVPLLSGGRGFVVVVPLFVGDVFRGLVLGGIGGVGRDNWLEALLADRFADYEAALIERGAEISLARAPDSQPAAEWAEERPIRIAGSDWLLRVTPTRDYVDRTGSVLPEAALGLGALLTTLLAICVYFFQTAQRRARDLSRANAGLVADINARKQAEEALRASEQRTRVIISAIKDCAIYMLDLEGRIATWNPGAAKLTGYSADEAIGSHFSILYPPDRKHPPEEDLDVAARDGWFEEECWHLRKDGSRYCGDDIISGIRDDSRELTGFSVVTRDATQRIELREQTERARDFYFSLFSDIPNLIWRSDAGGVCDYVNQAWLDYTGRATADETGAGWLEGVHPEDRKRWLDVYGNALQTKTPFEIEYRLRRGDGSYGAMICTGRPFHDMKGGFAGFLCSCYDNSVRREMERALQESEQRYEAITANIPGMVFQMIRDASGKLSFSYVSPGAEALGGVPAEAVLHDADAFLALIEPADRKNLLATIADSAERMVNCSWTGSLRPVGEADEKWVIVRARPRPAAPDVVLWDGLVLDDTRNRLAQIEIEHSREELRELSRHLQTVREEEKARIAREVHDELGSTLAALKMDVALLNKHLPSGPGAARDRRRSMDRLVDSAVAATRRIITDLRPAVLDGLGLCAALRWQANETQKASGVEILVRCPEGDVVVDRDRALTLFRIFQESLTNVIRHAKATRVDVDLTEMPANYELRVSDNGIGIADDAERNLTSHGIRGMRERALQLGGDVALSRGAEGGTVLLAKIPRD